MNKTKTTKEVKACDKVLVTTEALQELLSCGRSTAVAIGEDSHARVEKGRRVLWSVSKVKEYIEIIAE